MRSKAASTVIGEFTDINTMKEYTRNKRRKEVYNSDNVVHRNRPRQRIKVVKGTDMLNSAIHKYLSEETENKHP